MNSKYKSAGSNFKRKAPLNNYYHLGMLDPTKCKKYYSDCKGDPIIYRSGLELDFINYCEHSDGIVKWASEPIKIPYFSRLENSQKNYYPDYIIENKEGKRTIVEVKPYDLVVKPSPQSSEWLKRQWIRNKDKWKAAKEFAEHNNMKFIIITEKFFKGP